MEHDGHMPTIADSMRETTTSSTQMHGMMEGKMPNNLSTSAILSHQLSPTDPDNPMNWPLYRRVYASAVSWAFAFVVCVNTNSYYGLNLTGILGPSD